MCGVVTKLENNGTAWGRASSERASTHLRASRAGTLWRERREDNVRRSPAGEVNDIRLYPCNNILC